MAKCLRKKRQQNQILAEVLKRKFKRLQFVHAQAIELDDMREERKRRPNFAANPDFCPFEPDDGPVGWP